MRIVAFNGFKGSGKNTAATALREVAEAHDQTVMERGFAYKLKIMAALALGHQGTDDELYDIGDELKQDGVTIETTWPEGDDGQFYSMDQISGRQYLQFMGDRARYVFGEDFWVDQLCPVVGSKFRDIWGQTDWALITDLRYQNEARRVRELGGIVVEIQRPGTESDGHASEQQLPRELVDNVIANDGDIRRLRAKMGGLWGFLTSPNVREAQWMSPIPASASVAPIAQEM